MTERADGTTVFMPGGNVSVTPRMDGFHVAVDVQFEPGIPDRGEPTMTAGCRCGATLEVVDPGLDSVDPSASLIVEFQELHAHRGHTLCDFDTARRLRRRR